MRRGPRGKSGKQRDSSDMQSSQRPDTEMGPRLVGSGTWHHGVVWLMLGRLSKGQDHMGQDHP